MPLPPGLPTVTSCKQTATGTSSSQSQRSRSTIENHRRLKDEGDLIVAIRQVEQDILANGKVDGRELDVLRRQLYHDGKVGRQEADFLIELRKRVQHLTPA